MNSIDEKDLQALLTFSNENEKNEIQPVKKSNVISDNLEEKIIRETDELINASKGAIFAVLDEVQSAPNDAELISSASSFLRAQTGIIDAITKLHLSKEKFKQQIQLTKMKVESDQKMNTENNQTKVLLSRDEIMSRLLKDSEKVDDNDIIDF